MNNPSEKNVGVSFVSPVWQSRLLSLAAVRSKAGNFISEAGVNKRKVCGVNNCTWVGFHFVKNFSLGRNATVSVPRKAN